MPKAFRSAHWQTSTAERALSPHKHTPQWRLDDCTSPAFSPQALSSPTGSPSTSVRSYAETFFLRATEDPAERLYRSPMCVPSPPHPTPHASTHPRPLCSHTSRSMSPQKFHKHTFSPPSPGRVYPEDFFPRNAYDRPGTAPSPISFAHESVRVDPMGIFDPLIVTHSHRGAPAGTGWKGDANMCPRGISRTEKGGFFVRQ